MEYHTKAPMMEYIQNASKSYCFGSLASAFTAEGEKMDTRAI